MLQQIAFAITLIGASYFIRKRVLGIRANINLGKDKRISDNPSQRFRNMMLVAFGQKKMFKKVVPAIPTCLSI